MSSQYARNTAAGMVRDALACLVELECVQGLRHYTNTEEEAAHWLDFAQSALGYFESHYDFPQEDAAAKLEAIRDALDDSNDVWDSDLLDEINAIAFGKQESEVAE